MSERLMRACSVAGAAALLLLAVAAAQACGPDSDCAVGDRRYRIALPPERADGAPLGAIIFAHGYRGTAEGVMANLELRQVASQLGVALVAAQTVGEDWSIPGAPSDTASADELGYFDAVRADLVSRYGILPGRTVVAGFSAGGMMAWMLACRRGGDYAGFIAIAGTFWRPVPDTCHLPVANVLHIHGRADRIVPLEGRQIGDAHQGAVADALAMYAAFGNFSGLEPAGLSDLDCAVRRTQRGKILQFCLFEGGHDLHAAHVKAAWRSFEKLGVVGTKQPQAPESFKSTR